MTTEQIQCGLLRRLDDWVIVRDRVSDASEEQYVVPHHVACCCQSVAAWIKRHGLI